MRKSPAGKVRVDMTTMLYSNELPSCVYIPDANHSDIKCPAGRKDQRDSPSRETPACGKCFRKKRLSLKWCRSLNLETPQICPSFMILTEIHQNAICRM
jgi:hypothetical protein